jgi:hypothetical protein
LNIQFLLAHNNSVPASQEQNMLALERTLGSINIFAKKVSCRKNHTRHTNGMHYVGQMLNVK